MFNNTVYKCELLSVTPDIKVYTDKSMKSNVMNADTTVVNTILVQKTFNPSYFKEIVTGRLIPIYRVITYDTNTVLNGKVELDPPKSPCFIKYDMTVGDEGLLLSDNLVKATADEVSEYAFNHKHDELVVRYIVILSVSSTT